MLKLIASRLLQMLLIMGVVSALLFFIFDSDKFKKQIAVAELGGFAVSALSDQDYQGWLERKGLNVPFYERYAKWVGGILTGDLGKSYQTNEPVATLVLERLKKTGILGFWVFALIIPLSLTCGIIAGMKEGSAQDRITSFISVVTTSLPEIATAVILMSVFALGSNGFRRIPPWSAAGTGWRWSCP